MLKNIFFLILLFSQVILARELESATKVQKTEPDSWYFLFSAGMGYTGHDSVDNNAIEGKKAQGAVNLYSGGGDIPGIYYRLGSGDMMGITFRPLVQNFSAGWQAAEEIVFNNYNYNLSYMHFLKGTIGVGWFARGDIGYSELWRIVKTSNQFASDRFTGIHYGAAVGYSWMFPNEMSFFISLDQTYSDLDTHILSGNRLNVGLIL